MSGEALDVAAIMAEHANHHGHGSGGYCCLCTHGPRCLPYRLAAEVATLREVVAPDGVDNHSCIRVEAYRGLLRHIAKAEREIATLRARERRVREVVKKYYGEFDPRFGGYGLEAALNAALDDPTEPEQVCGATKPNGPRGGMAHCTRRGCDGAHRGGVPEVTWGTTEPEQGNPVRFDFSDAEGVVTNAGHAGSAALSTRPEEVQAEPPREVETIDLVAALRASVEAAKKRREAAAALRPPFTTSDGQPLTSGPEQVQR